MAKQGTVMELRDYFAAHAPRRPQAWFTPVMDADRPAPIHPCTGSATCNCTYEICWVDNLDVLNAWDNEYGKRLLIQWPYAWADAMLAERAK
jgi:hypothetical protein